MTKRIFLLFFTFFTTLIFGQSITTIKGFAPDYVGKEIKIYEYSDLLSMKEDLIATSVVKEDSSFSLTFENSKIEKVVIRSNNNSSFVYIAPNETIKIYLPLHDKDKPYRPLGNYVTSIFLNLDSTDINYKIIHFNDALDRFYALNLVKFVRNRQAFIDNLKLFKDSVYKALPDTNNFLRKYVHYSFANVDLNLYTSEKAQKYIFDTYLDRKRVLYDIEPYFRVIKDIYSMVFSQLPMEINNKVYLAVIKKSPTLLMRALEDSPILGPSYDVKDGHITKVYSNQQLRELVMIRGLSEVYNSKDYPKTNIEEILDSIIKFPLYPENGKIAQNIYNRLTQATEGNPAPEFAFVDRNGKMITNKSLEDKYVYLHIMDPEFKTATQDIELLEQIYGRYSDIANFITIYPSNKKPDKKTAKAIQNIPWNVVVLGENDDFFKKYKVNTFPSYVLIDRTGMVVQLPALGPKPNSEYLTIDKVFFDIKKIENQMKGKEAADK